MTAGTSSLLIEERVGVLVGQDIVLAELQPWCASLSGFDVTGQSVGGVSQSHSSRPRHTSVALRALNTNPQVSFRIDELVRVAGETTSLIETTIQALGPITALYWLEPSVADILAASFCADTWCGQGGVQEVVADIGPFEALVFATPLGAQILTRIRKNFDSCGATFSLLLREASSRLALANCKVPIIRQTWFAPIARRAPMLDQQPKHTLELNIELFERDGLPQFPSIVGNSKDSKMFWLALLSLRRTAPLHVVLTGSSAKIGRSTPFIEDLVANDVSVSVPKPDLQRFSHYSASTDWLMSSPLLQVSRADGADAVNFEFSGIRATNLGRKWHNGVPWVKGISDARQNILGYGVKDFVIDSRFIRLDSRE